MLNLKIVETVGCADLEWLHQVSGLDGRIIGMDFLPICASIRCGWPHPRFAQNRLLRQRVLRC